MKGRARAAMLATWKQGEKAITDGGFSSMQLLDELVPVAKREQSDDPAQKAVEGFHEAAAGIRGTSFVLLDTGSRHRDPPPLPQPDDPMYMCTDLH